MIKNIISRFYRDTKFNSDNEVALFRKLSIAIQSESNSVLIDETHGGGFCNVSFVSPTNKTETCEISDLLIMSYSREINSWRATFWQAKKQGVSKWNNVAQNGTQLDFKGQFNQWDLLSRRPEVVGVKTFKPPKDILSCFPSSSIGSYGVFYEKSGQIEVAHSIAEFISCPSPSTKSPTLAVNGYLEKYPFQEGELISTLTLDGFLTALFDFKIGSKLEVKNSTHCWLMTLVKSKLKEKEQLQLSQYVDDFLNQDNGDNFINDDVSDGLSILVVDVDSKKHPKEQINQD